MRIESSQRRRDDNDGDDGHGGDDGGDDGDGGGGDDDGDQCIHGHRAHRRWNRRSRAGPIRKFQHAENGSRLARRPEGEFVTAVLWARCRGTVQGPFRKIGRSMPAATRSPSLTRRRSVRTSRRVRVVALGRHRRDRIVVFPRIPPHQPGQGIFGKLFQNVTIGPLCGCKISGLELLRGLPRHRAQLLIPIVNP
jgi:hypothetical protein